MNHFIDYYEDLQISANADKETIDSVYKTLARRWHPDNTSTGDSEKFKNISEAHRVLSDPEQRAAYDAEYESNRASQWEAFSQFSSPEKATNDIDLRESILSILYVSRRQEPENAGVGVWRLAKLVGWPEKELSFHVWYLKEKKFIKRDDSGGYVITAEGVDLVENRKFEKAEPKLIAFDRKPQNISKYTGRDSGLKRTAESQGSYLYA